MAFVLERVREREREAEGGEGERGERGTKRMQEREDERERMRKKKNAREGDVMVESSDVMPREREWAGWGIGKTPATRSAFSLTAAILWSTLVKCPVFIRVIRKSLTLLKHVSKEQKE